MTNPSSKLYLASHLCTCQSTHAPLPLFNPSFGIWLHFYHRIHRNKALSPHCHPPSIKGAVGFSRGWETWNGEHSCKVSDRIQCFISESARGGIEPAVTVWRKGVENTPNLCGDWMSVPTSRAQHDGLSWFTTSAPIGAQWRRCLLTPAAMKTAAISCWTSLSFFTSQAWCWALSVWTILKIHYIKYIIPAVSLSCDLLLDS